MRFLFISNFYPPHDIGGYEKHCQEVTDGLRARGHDVHVLTSRYGLRAPVQEEHVHRVLFLESDLRHYNPLHFFFRRRYQERHNIIHLKSFVSDFEPHVILFWGMWNLSRRLPAEAEHSNWPVAYWLEDLWPLDPDMHTRYWHLQASSRLWRVVMPLVSGLALHQLRAEGYPPLLQYRHVACGSRFLQHKLATQIPAFQKAAIVMCGINLQMFANCHPHLHLFDSTAPRLIYVGGLSPHKGVHTLLEAVAYMQRKAPQLQPRVTIVGSGHPDYVARLNELATKTGITEHIQFTGPVVKHAVPALLAKHDILVVPSAWEEPFGRVVVEGMAAGLVVVGTGTGGSAEILQHEVNGLVFPAEDAPALAVCLLRLVRDPALYARLAAAGKETSRQFDLQHMIDGIERFLFDVAAQRREERAG